MDVVSGVTSAEQSGVITEPLLLATLCHDPSSAAGVLMRFALRLPTVTGTTRTLLSDVVVVSSSSAEPWKKSGPVIVLGVAAAGRSLPRPLPPDRQSEAATAGTAGWIFLVGPVAGQLGLPCWALSRAYSLVDNISGEARAT